MSATPESYSREAVAAIKADLSSRCQKLSPRFWGSVEGKVQLMASDNDPDLPPDRHITFNGKKYTMPYDELHWLIIPSGQIHKEIVPIPGPAFLEMNPEGEIIKEINVDIPRVNLGEITSEEYFLRREQIRLRLASMERTAAHFK